MKDLSAYGLFFSLIAVVMIGFKTFWSLRKLNRRSLEELDKLAEAIDEVGRERRLQAIRITELEAQLEQAKALGYDPDMTYEQSVRQLP